MPLIPYAVLSFLCAIKVGLFSHVGQGGELYLNPRGGTDTYLSSLGHETESSSTIDAVPRLSMRDARLGWSVMSLCPLLSGRSVTCSASGAPRGRKRSYRERSHALGMNALALSVRAFMRSLLERKGVLY